MKSNKDQAAKYYRVIMDAIVTQELPPSKKVSENIFCDLFGMSRTIARNLIERLIAQQFLVSSSARITQVAPLTLFEIRQNFTLRKMILPEVISKISTKIDSDQIKVLNDAILKLMPIKNDTDALKLMKLNKELNLALCEPMNYPLLHDWIEQLEETTMRIYWLYYKITGKFPYSGEQQSSVLNMLQKEEPGRIKQFAYDVLAQAEERILNAVLSNEQFYKQDLTI